MVCGAIAFGDVWKIRDLYRILKNEGFNVLEHIDKKQMDYSKIKDFTKKKELAKRIVEHDLRYVEDADVLIIIFNDKPSYGSAIEMYAAKKVQKKVILFAQGQIPTPWAVNYSDYIINNEKELLALLHDLQV